MTDVKYTVWLAESCGHCSPLGLALLREYGSCEAVYDNRDSLSSRIKVPGFSLEKAEQIVAECQEKDITIFSLEDEQFPVRLSSIQNPPVALYAQGNLSLLTEIDNQPAISIVGTRSMTAHGEKAALHFAYSLARGGIMVISGMAAGIDTTAHKGALKAGGKTIAVFGCGVDITYPSQNTKAHEVIVKRGLVVSEYPPGTKPYSFQFPQRNRIISALSQGTMVVEAKERSGSLLTAGLAVEQGRDVYILMTDYDRKGSASLCRLINDGAVAVNSPREIFEAYSTQFGDKLNHEAFEKALSLQFFVDDSYMPAYQKSNRRQRTKENNPSQKAKQSATIATSEQVTQDNADMSTDAPQPEKGREPRKITLPDYVSEAAKTIFTLLNAQPQHVDVISQRAGLSAGIVSASLTELEICGAVISLPGRLYVVEDGSKT